jgi:murein DD-endopeptidase MepM/ murein hydrolase activator NlpD
MLVAINQTSAKAAKVRRFGFFGVIAVLVLIGLVYTDKVLKLNPASASTESHSINAATKAAAPDKDGVEIPSPKGGSKLIGTNKNWSGDPHSYPTRSMRLIREDGSDAGWNMSEVLYAAWSANGRSYVLEDANHQIYVGGLREPPAMVMSGYVTPALSPSGKTVAAQRLGTGDNGFERLSSSPGIVVKDMAKGTERIVVANDVYTPFFIAENKLGFGSGGEEEVASLYMIQLANGKVIKLTNKNGKEKAPDPFPSEMPTVSDDGSQLIIKWGENGAERSKTITLPEGDAQDEKGKKSKDKFSHARLPVKVIMPKPSENMTRSVALMPQSGKVLFQRPVSPYKGVYQYYSHAGRDWGCGTITYTGHEGTDFKADTGTQVYASAAGTVYQRYDGCANSGYLGSTCGSGYGNHVRVEHSDGRISIYGHMMSGTPIGYVGVVRGQYVGTSASSGSSNAPHVHFEPRISRIGAAVDPYYGSCDTSGTSDWIGQSAYPNGDVSYVSPPWWSFDTNGNFEGWSVFNISAASVNNGSLFIDPWGGDPYARVEPIYVDAASFPYIQIRMGSNALDGNGAIYFKTQSGGYDELRKVTFQVYNCPSCGTAPYYYYSVYMGNNPYWNGVVTGLRIDPGENGQGGTNTDSIGIDFVRFSSTP